MCRPHVVKSKILAALKISPATVHGLVAATSHPDVSVNSILKLLRQDKIIYIVRYELGARNIHVRVYGLGNLPDATKPLSLRNARKKK